MDVFYAYTYGSAGWFGLQGLALILSPTIVVALLSPEIRDPSSIELYFSRSLGMALLTLGIMVVLLTGSVPLTSTFSDTTHAGVTSDAADPKAPYAVPTLTISTIYHVASASYCYVHFNRSGQVSFALGALGAGVMSIVGLWCILFATGDGRISRKTGADKRTSGFPFSNTQSASAKKRAGKEL